jgi:hypothetical protein
MPLQLHEQCKVRLVEVLTKALAEVQAENGMFIDRSTAGVIVAGDAILPRTGKLHEKLLSYIDDFPLTEFVIQTLGRELWELDRYDRERTSVMLPEIEGYTDTAQLAARLVGSFNSLPWTYELTFPLPEHISTLVPSTVMELPLASNVRLVRPSDEFTKLFSLKTEHERRQERLRGGTLIALMTGPPEWDNQSLYLQILAEGFVGQYGGTATATGAERLVRAFCGLGIAERLFDFKHRYSQSAVKSYYYAHRRAEDGTWIPESRIEVEDATARGLQGIELHTLDGRLDSDEKKYGWAFHRLRNIAIALSAGPKAEQIILASQWLFDSYTSRDLLLSFVQSMVVLEILLGDKKTSDIIGIGELMRNRFAYLIGTNQQERTALMDEFNKIYYVRSQIVHSGKHRLTLEERMLFSRLRWMCQRLIDKELELLKADPSTAPPPF